MNNFALRAITLAAIAFLSQQAFAAPSAADIQAALDAAYEKYKDLDEGANADYIPILTTVPSDLFGVVIMTTEGAVYAAGDVDYAFSIQSVSKPFNAALVMQQSGSDALREQMAAAYADLSGTRRVVRERVDRLLADTPFEVSWSAPIDGVPPFETPADATLVRAARGLGLGVVNALPPLRRGLIREAAGVAGDVPLLLKGQPL